MRMCHFWAQNGPLALNKIFLGQTIIITFIYLLVLFTVQNLKNSSRASRVMGRQFLGPKWPISPNKNFFRKPVNEPCFFHSCLSTHQKSKSDIKRKEYWNFIGRETFLAITWEPDFPQACSFRRVLMNHKNFQFTQIPNKTNDVILPCFWAIFNHFWSFLPDEDFFKKTGCHTELYMGP